MGDLRRRGAAGLPRAGARLRRDLRAATRGRRLGVAAALGAQLGLCVHVLLSVVGLSVLLSRHPDLLTTVRVLGGLYLLYLAGRLVVPTFRGAAPAGSAEQPRTDAPHADRSSFLQGFLTNLLNPKAVLFFAAVLPQFVSGPAPTWVQVSVLGALDVLLGLVAWAAVVLVGARLGGLLRRDRVRRWWDRTTGAGLGLLGGGLLATTD
ncbi:LysE family translocator [Nocardioides sp. Arc9.136]|uniref:LysE family translocator n=1 Tax=Nocardioides sp. Arc9.136 TaxID=2996826 RepID=UPI002665522D|nr:LysE family transporter [Nocardioides sp. Arc9.136]WKN50638.1 LysE family transporter [Nocardioides sp. Arc9.136]